MDEAGELILKKGEPIQSTYEWFIPASFNTEVIIAVALMIAGIATIYLMDKVSANETT